MTRPKKCICSLIATGLLVGFMPAKTHAGTVPSLTVYAGPQSVSPSETIYVSVEFTGEGGSILNDGAVELSYMSDGILKTVSGTTELGLISFDVPAQHMIGLMRFSAKAANVISKEALVTVVAGGPQPFKIKAQQSKELETLKLTSDVITDSHGNPISDLSLMSLEWIDYNGLRARQTVQPLNGRIVFAAKCPASFTSPLRVRASIEVIESFSQDVSADCLAGRG